MAGCDGLSGEQREVLETVAAADRNFDCLQPVLEGRRRYAEEAAEAIVPPGFVDLARAAEGPSIRLHGESIGAKAISPDPNCASAAVPSVSGDRALVVVGLGVEDPGFMGSGLAKRGGDWAIVERRRTASSH